MILVSPPRISIFHVSVLVFKRMNCIIFVVYFLILLCIYILAMSSQCSHFLHHATYSSPVYPTYPNPLYCIYFQSIIPPIIPPIIPLIAVSGTALIRINLPPKLIYTQFVIDIVVSSANNNHVHCVVYAGHTTHYAMNIFSHYSQSIAGSCTQLTTNPRVYTVVMTPPSDAPPVYTMLLWVDPDPSDLTKPFPSAIQATNFGFIQIFAPSPDVTVAPLQGKTCTYSSDWVVYAR